MRGVEAAGGALVRLVVKSFCPLLNRKDLGNHFLNGQQKGRFVSDMT